MNYEKLKRYIRTPKSIEDKLDEIDTVSRNSGLALEKKVDFLLKIYDSLSDDKKGQREGRYLIIRIGEVYFQENAFEDALDNYGFVMRFKNTVGNPFLHLRLGQIQYHIKNKERMHDELSRALIMGGEIVFEDENSKFIEIPKSVLREPENCSWKEYDGQDWESTK
ncbi:hypothetical protein [Aureispira anguillae]|uniref:Uncharacterized protein n=1 Tax=Aureispira anguillae TaxID=2864201 RepID=A0A915YHF1_9BACT|nr:hypothetical protein [Aureispira anguillae]BDS13110.1 hypothetical protein AsAng_0038380 [Aureispira anguillae]